MSAPSSVSTKSPSAMSRRPIEAMDPQVRTIQPGGGFVMTLELAWGHVRRAALRTLRPGYVARMRAARIGQLGGCPFDPIDSRDTKYYQNQGTYRWAPEHDPFAWRDRLPFIRVGLAELMLMGGSLLALAVALGLWHPALVLPPLVVLSLVVWFFRNPRRRIPSAPGLVVAPADGKVVEVAEVVDSELGPAVQIGIFLSIFNVHVNRASIAGRVIGVRYRPGKFLNALRPESARENEHLELQIEQSEPPHRLIKIRQITGAIARRIVCCAAPGDELKRGEVYGMIKLGSRTELVLPLSSDLQVETRVGEIVRAGSSVLARYAADSATDQGE